MARIKTNNLLYNVSGKVGNQIYFQRNGRTYVREVSNSVAPPTQKQLVQRMRFTRLTTVLNSMRGFVNVGFGEQAKSYRKEPFSLAVSLNWENVFIGTYPNIDIDYSQLILSAGDIYSPRDVDARISSKGIIFTWGTEENTWDLVGCDQVMVLAYIPSLQKSIFKTHVSSYASHVYELELNGLIRGVEIETFFAFVSHNGKEVSYTAYTGSLVW